ncbi:MAG: type II secretion system protein GspG [Pontiellaceae bacterium]|nr:type II secretion system protein GspG [Pontiellaceae bacterium]MBN2783389.1 type II secretion system protein GspG [Pontiellaceae bacterium]
MKHNRRKKYAAKSGFTLIEIILVIVIVGMLAAIALKGIDPAQHTERARVVTATTDISMLSSALELYEMNNANYPESLEGLLDNSKQGFPFLRQQVIPKDPWGNQYTYTVPGSHNTYSFDISCTSSKTGKTYNNWGKEESNE